jgi:phage terminase large subunit
MYSLFLDNERSHHLTPLAVWVVLDVTTVLAERTNTRMASDGHLTAKQLSRVTNVNYSTIQHWSREDLLEFERDGRERLYPHEENVRRISFIRKMQRKKDYQALSSIKSQIEQKQHLSL